MKSEFIKFANQISAAIAAGSTGRIGDAETRYVAKIFLDNRVDIDVVETLKNLVATKLSDGDLDGDEISVLVGNAIRGEL